MKNLHRKAMERAILEKLNPSGARDKSIVKRALINKTNEQLEQLCKAHGIEVAE